MTNDISRPKLWARAVSGRLPVLITVFGLIAGGAVIWIAKSHSRPEPASVARTLAPSRDGSVFYPTSAQWASLTVEPAQQRVFRSEQVTEGKIAVDEDRSTPIFSPYAGRVTKLFVKAGEIVQVGQPLFTVEAADMVQAQNDFIAALTGLNKARAQLDHAQIVDKRHRLLYEGKAVPLKDLQQARATLDVAENDLRSSGVALEAARSRLRQLGKTEAEIAAFQEKGTIDPATTIYSPIAGTIVQRKVGPGQYVGTGASDPVFIVGDLSTVWLAAYIREIDAPTVRVGQALHFTVLAYPDEVFPANISYVAPGIEPGTRRLLVRATINNASGLFKPEMYASVRIITSEGDWALAVPRDAVIFERGGARVWVAREDKAVELRRIKVGPPNGNMIEVTDGLVLNDRVVTKGSAFIDRVAAGS